jgi:hypothetical protein
MVLVSVGRRLRHGAKGSVFAFAPTFGKFVSFEFMITDSKHIVNLEQGSTSTPEVQPIAFKATEEKKEESTPS